MISYNKYQKLKFTKFEDLDLSSRTKSKIDSNYEYFYGIYDKSFETLPIETKYALCNKLLGVLLDALKTKQGQKTLTNDIFNNDNFSISEILKFVAKKFGLKKIENLSNEEISSQIAAEINGIESQHLESIIQKMQTTN